MGDILIFLAVLYVGKIILKALWGGWTSNDYRRDR